ncbi:MAG: Rab family GTPase [Candidatus Kariarchaeaceae archaeon]
MTEEDASVFHPIKIVLMGEAGVGKTSVRKRYLGEEFNVTYFPTLGADYSIKPIKISEKVTLNSNIWDIAGQENLAFLRQRFLIDVLGAFIVFDLTDRMSITRIDKWIKELIDANKRRKIPVLLIGNKSDLVGSRAISREDVGKLQTSLIEDDGISISHLEYIETSAKTGENIEVAFNSLAQIIYDKIISR